MHKISHLDNSNIYHRSFLLLSYQKILDGTHLWGTIKQTLKICARIDASLTTVSGSGLQCYLHKMWLSWSCFSEDRDCYKEMKRKKFVCAINVMTLSNNLFSSVRVSATRAPRHMRELLMQDPANTEPVFWRKSRNRCTVFTMWREEIIE